MLFYFIVFVTYLFNVIVLVHLLNVSTFIWQDELLPMVKSKGLTLSFSSESSIEEELKRESTADVITIAVSFLILFYLLFILFIFIF